MGENSSIEWADHTFNPWWGCTRVSRACQNCYAEAFAKRVEQQVWGPKAERRLLSDANWQQPIRWNAAAAAGGRRDRVFCASMADVFENRHDLDVHRERLWQLIADTPHLDWLLLTKRPELTAKLVPWGKRWPTNVWIGTTVEDQKAAEARLPHLVRLPAVVRFISAEPLMSALDLSPWIDRLDWVIAGGESGGRAQPSSPDHFRDLRDQCIAAGVAFLFKQWGEYAPATRKGAFGSMTVATDDTLMRRVGKGTAGRRLDRRYWSEFPVPRA